MKRLLILFLLVAQASSAGPFNWIKRLNPIQPGPKHWVTTHKRFLLMEGAAIAGAGIHAAGLHHCRRLNGVEPCDGHYGEAWAIFGITASLNVIAAPTIAESCWKDGGGKFCNVIAYGGSTAELSHGIYQWRIYKPESSPLLGITLTKEK